MTSGLFYKVGMFLYEQGCMYAYALTSEFLFLCQQQNKSQ